MTPWLLDGPLLVAGLMTLVAIMLLWLRFRQARMSVPALAAVGGLYGVFAAYLAGISTPDPRREHPGAGAPGFFAQNLVHQYKPA